MSPATTGATAPTAKPPKTTAPTLPHGQLELATLAESAATAWAASALPALLWLPKAQLGSMASAYKASIATADAANDPLGITAQRLAALDRELDASLKFMRNYLLEAYGREGAQARYAEFGLKSSGKLPTARPARVAALPKLLAALLVHKLDKSKYGTTYWQPLATEYAALAKGSSTTRQNASGQADTKNSQEKPLRKALRGLKPSIRANFPDTEAAELRRFGFLAESF